MHFSPPAMISAVATALLSLSALGQHTPPSRTPTVTGTPGSPHATSTIPGDQLPPPDPKFGGVIKERASESTPW